MENISFLFTSSSSSRASALTSAGIAGHPALAAALLLVYVLMGLFWYFRAFWSNRRHLNVFQEAIVLSMSLQRDRLRGVQNIHGVLLSMLLIDIASGITTVIMAAELFSYSSLFERSFSSVVSVWYLFRYHGLVLHFTNAFVCLLFLCHPHWGSRLRFVSMGVVLLICVFIPFYIYFSRVTIFGLGGISIALALAIIAKFIASSGSSSSAATQKKTIVIVAMITFTIVFAPSFILECLITSGAENQDQFNNYIITYVNVLFFTNWHIPMDGLLCFFILKLSSEEEEREEEQQPQQPGFENSNYDGSGNVIP